MDRMTDLFVGALVLLGPVWLGWSFHSPLTHTYGATSGATPSASDVEAPPPGCVAADGTQVFLPEDIAPFDGTHPSGKILLVVLGQVFDVTRGAQHYGAADGQRTGYNIFAGMDNSRAFVSGEFDRSQDYDPPLWDVSQMKDADLPGIDEWRSFYHKEEKYSFEGYLNAPDGYYTCQGEKTERLKDVEARLASAAKAKDANKKAADAYPGCNSHYAQGKGGRVWCPNEKLVPRLGKLPHDGYERCACYTPQYAERNSDVLKPYAGCSPRASSCDIKAT